MSHVPDEDILSGLLAGLTGAQVAQAAGCSRATVVRRLSDPTFRARLSELRRAALAEVVTTLTVHATRAAGVLAAGLDAERPQDRMAAATAVLDRLSRLTPLVEPVPIPAPPPSLDLDAIAERVERYLVEEEETKAAHAQYLADRGLARDGKAGP